MAKVPGYRRNVSVLVNYAPDDLELVHDRFKVLYGRLEDRVRLRLARLEPGVFDSLDPGHEFVFGGGSNLTFSNNPTLRAEAYRYIHRLAVPAMGICFGAQAIGQAYNGRLAKLPEKRLGGNGITVDAAIGDLPAGSTFQGYESHAWSLQRLPATEFNVLAHNPDGIEVFLHRVLPVAGTQFHPEIEPETYPDAVEAYHGLRTVILDRKRPQ